VGQSEAAWSTSTRSRHAILEIRATLRQRYCSNCPYLGIPPNERLALGRRVADQHISDEGLPARLHLNAVIWRFLWEQHQAIARWAAWADDEIRHWSGIQDTPALSRRGRRVLRQVHGRSAECGLGWRTSRVRAHTATPAALTGEQEFS
jgi:hypothetical protein